MSPIAFPGDSAEWSEPLACRYTAPMRATSSG